MEIRYQQNTTDTIKISKDTINIHPLVIDYSPMYKYNQYTAFGTIETIVHQHEDGSKYVSDELITNDNVMVTDKVDSYNNPLFYQYQLKYDCMYPDNIKIRDRNDKILVPNLEYGYIKLSGLPDEAIRLSYNNTTYEESFDGYLLYAHIDSAVTYGPLYSYPSLLGGEGPDLPYKVYGACMTNGIVYLHGDMLSNINSGVVSMTFLVKNDSTADTYQFLESGYTESGIFIPNSGDIHFNIDGTNSIDFNIGGGAEVSCSGIMTDMWYRLDYYFNNSNNTSTVYIQDVKDNSTFYTHTFDKSMFNDLISTDKFRIGAGCNVVFDMGIFEHSLTDIGIGIQDPLFIFRYSKSIEWNSTKYAAGPYRMRLIFETDEPLEVIYDGVDAEGHLIQNIKEEINYRSMYKKYPNYASNDWIWSVGEIIFTDYLASRVTPEVTKIYVQGVPENQVKVFYDELDKRIHVTSGMFYGDYYNPNSTELNDGDRDYYYIPEYEVMPFASDNQTTFQPYYIKVIRESVDLINPYKLKLSMFYMYEGDYPNYLIPNMPEIYKYFDKDSNLVIINNGIDINYRSARGINIYKNGILVDNSEIINYNMYEGFIEFKSKFSTDDRIEVTYLKSMPDYILKYPNINTLLERNKNFRLYMRPYYEDYSIYNTADTQFEKLCYRVIENGTPTGNYISCYSGMPISTDSIERHQIPYDRIIAIADIAVITDLSFEDTRERGGGIKEELSNSFELSPSFLDIGFGVNGKVLYNSILIIKIPLSVKSDMITKYFFNDEKGAMTYIKQSIEQYLAAGTFYVLIDENNDYWPEPYPLSVTG